MHCLCVITKSCDNDNTCAVDIDGPINCDVSLYKKKDDAEEQFDDENIEDEDDDETDSDNSFESSDEDETEDLDESDSENSDYEDSDSELEFYVEAILEIRL